MKKLSLSNLKLSTRDVLEKGELKIVFGGYDHNCDYNHGCGPSSIPCCCESSTGSGYYIFVGCASGGWQCDQMCGL